MKPNSPKMLELACIALVLANCLIMYAVMCDIYYIKLIAVAYLAIQAFDHVKNTKKMLDELERNNSR